MADENISTGINAFNMMVNTVSTSILTAQQMMLQALESLNDMANSKNEYKELANKLSNGDSLLSVNSMEDARDICQGLKKDGIKVEAIPGIGCGVIAAPYGSYEKAEQAIKKFYEDTSIDAAVDNSMHDDVARSIATSEAMVTNLKSSGPIENSKLSQAVQDDSQIMGMTDRVEAQYMLSEMREQDVHAQVAQEKGNFYLIIPKGEELRAEEVRTAHYIDQAKDGAMQSVREYLDQPEMGGAVDMVQLHHYDKGSEQGERLNLPNDHAVILENKLKRENIPYVLNHSSDERTTITYAKRDAGAVKTLHAESSVEVEGKNGNLYSKQADWRAQYNRQLMETVTCGEYPDGQAVKPGTTLVNEQGHTAYFQRRYVAFQEGDKIRTIPKGRTEEIQKAMSRFMATSKDAVLMSPQEYESYRRTAPEKRVDCLYQKERDGDGKLLVRPSLKKEDLKKIAEDQRKQVAIFVRLSQDGYPTPTTRQLTPEEAKTEFGLSEKEVKQMETLNVGIQPSKPEEISDEELVKIENALDVELDGKLDEQDRRCQGSSFSYEDEIQREALWDNIINATQDITIRNETQPNRAQEAEKEKGEATR